MDFNRLAYHRWTLTDLHTHKGTLIDLHTHKGTSIDLHTHDSHWTLANLHTHKQTHTFTTFVEHIGLLCTHELKYMEFILTFVHLRPKLVEQNVHTTHVNYICGVVGLLCKHKPQSMDHIGFLCT